MSDIENTELEQAAPAEEKEVIKPIETKKLKMKVKTPSKSTLDKVRERAHKKELARQRALEQQEKYKEIARFNKKEADKEKCQVLTAIAAALGKFIMEESINDDDLTNYLRAMMASRGHDDLLETFDAWRLDNAYQC